MQKFIVKYLIMLFVTAGLFTQFIACGSENYKADVDGAGGRAAISDDPDSMYFGIHSLSGWTKIPIEVKFGSQYTDEQAALVRKAMETWEMAVGKELFVETGFEENKTGDEFSDLYSSLDDKNSGHYIRFDWDKTGKPTAVLATAIWNSPGNNPDAIDAGDIHYNSDHYTLGDALNDEAMEEKEIVDLWSLALHELGHFLGLAHVSEDVDPYSIMNPTLFIGPGMFNRSLSEGDVKRIQQIYGCVADACNVNDVLVSIEANVDTVESSNGSAH